MSRRDCSARAGPARWGALLLLLAACDAGSGSGAAPSGPTASSAAPSATAGAEPTGSSTASSAPAADPALAACPARVPGGDGQPWVPAPPTTQTQGRLVPDADPVEALLCRYGPLGADGAGPDGAVLLTDGLTSIRLDLALPAGTPAPCPAAATPLPHLLRLTYADGDLWLSALQGCEGASNGAFTTAEPLGERLAQAYATRTWPASTR